MQSYSVHLYLETALSLHTIFTDIIYCEVGDLKQKIAILISFMYALMAATYSCWNMQLDQTSKNICSVARQCTCYVNFEARSCNHCCSEIAIIIITYSEGVFLALRIQNAMRLRHIVICGCSLLSSFFLLPHKRQDFREKNFIEHKMCCLISYTTFVWNISHSTRNSARYHACTEVFVQSTLFSSEFDITWIFSVHFFEKSSNMEFNENPSSGRRVVPCRRKDRRTDRQDEASSRFS
jgi:hypothetical protein